MKTQTVRILKAQTGDISEIFHIEQQCFTVPWSFDMIYSDVVMNAVSTYFIAKNIQNRALGFGGMYTGVDEAHITNIAVLPESRKQGVAGMLLSAMITEAQYGMCGGMTLEVRVSNEAAIGLYEKYGFKIEGMRKQYYSDNREDAYIMWLRFG